MSIMLFVRLWIRVANEAQQPRQLFCQLLCVFPVFFHDTMLMKVGKNGDGYDEEPTAESLRMYHYPSVACPKKQAVL